MNYYDFVDSIAAPHKAVTNRIIERLFSELVEARERKDYALADGIRGALSGVGVTVGFPKDRPPYWNFDGQGCPKSKKAA